MNDAQSWRDLLGTLVSDPRELQRMTRELGVHPVTVLRWTRGKASPRASTLQALPDLFPHARKQLAMLIAEAEPAFSYETEADEEIEIPATLYARVFHTLAWGAQRQRGWSILTLVIQQILDLLDPMRTGLGVTIAQCVPPRAGKKVRSFRVIMGQGTGPWQHYLGYRTQFLGAESRIGRAVMTGGQVIVNDAVQQERVFSGHHPPLAESALTSPLLKSDHIAGCLGVFSVKPDYFTPARQDLLERYANLLLVAFNAEEFYSLRDIDLNIMPPHEKQRSILAQFQWRVNQRIIDATCVQQFLTTVQAETQVWQDIEEYLIQAALDPVLSPLHQDTPNHTREE